MTFKSHYSQDPDAMRSRAYYWSHEEFREHQIEKSRKRHAQERMAEVRKTQSMLRPNRQTIDSKVRFHMSRGRDVGDIAVRMNIPVSYVVTAMERIKIEQSNPTQSEETP